MQGYISADYKNACKRGKWLALIDDIEHDPWGLKYRVFMYKLGAFAKLPVRPTEEMNCILDLLVPTHPRLTGMELLIERKEIEAPMSNKMELLQSARSMKN